MKPYLFILTTLLFSSFIYSQQMDETKKEIIESIESHKENIISISDKIWRLAETSFEEFESSKLLSDYAKKTDSQLKRM